jgi:heptaprenyl diphosphate synthase/octaprenyl-diphosphate synthase
MVARARIEPAVYAPVEDGLRKVVASLKAVAAADGGDIGPNEAVRERLAHVLAASGKRVRPAITLLAAGLWGRPTDANAVTMATAVELLHVATLVHDDTVDRADRRRGHATASNLWGSRIAVLLGDYLFATSARFVCDTNNVQVIRRFAETIMELAKGELTEMLDAGSIEVTRDVYLERIYNKTASLFSTASESGAVLSGAAEEDIARLRDYGYNVGMAYQVMDDVLDFMATSEELGKPSCNDLRQGILTLPSIMLVEGSSAGTAIAELFASAPDDRDIFLQHAVDEIRQSDILERSVDFAREYVSMARRALEPIPDSAARDSLLALADFATSRTS